MIKKGDRIRLKPNWIEIICRDENPQTCPQMKRDVLDANFVNEYIEVKKVQKLKWFKNPKGIYDLGFGRGYTQLNQWSWVEDVFIIDGQEVIFRGIEYV